MVLVCKQSVQTSLCLCLSMVDLHVCWPFALEHIYMLCDPVPHCSRIFKCMKSSLRMLDYMG